MNYKNWPYWVKGGAVAGSIGLLLSGGWVACNAVVSWATLGGFSDNCIIGVLPGWFFTDYLAYVLHLRSVSLVEVSEVFMLTVENTLALTLGGIIIGYLYGKFKNRNQIR